MLTHERLTEVLHYDPKGAKVLESIVPGITIDMVNLEGAYAAYCAAAANLHLQFARLT